MKSFRRLALAFLLMTVFALPALAGETQGPPCANPGETQTPPGEMQAPPCAANPDSEAASQSSMAQTAGYAVSEEVDGLKIETVLFLIQDIL